MASSKKTCVLGGRKIALCLLAAIGGAMVGCADEDKNAGSTLDFKKGLLDPTAVGRFNKQPLVVPILSSLDRGVDVGTDQFRNAVDVTPEDYAPSTNDYLIGRNDLISVAITDLVAPNVETVRTNRVSESGMISLPLIGQVKAAGLTEAQLEKEISKAYKQANVIQNAQVSVSVTEARARTFSILGAVTQPGQYAILNSDFRVMDALVLARDVNATGLDYIYVIRQTQAEPAPAAPADQTKPATPADDALTPKSDAGGTHAIYAQAAATTNAVSGSVTGEDQKFITVDGKQVTVTPAATAPAATPAPTAQAAPATSEPAAQATQPAGAFQFRGPVSEGKTKIIRIAYDALRNGDLRYNIVIKPYDMVVVPQPTIGEYYMGGHVSRVGVYSLTARKITLKQAIVSAGMFDQIAIPAQTDVIRRIEGDREIFVSVDLDKVFDGSQPDIFLKPNDVVQVGTTWWAPFTAALRGAFRMTYGFGFLYDRNYAPSNTSN